MSNRRNLLAACLFILSLAAAPLSARAHAIIIASHPANGATLAAGPVAFDLRYNSRIDKERSRLTLTRPDSSTTVLPIGGGAAPDVLTSRANLPPGAYSLRWQVLAIDGHITRGDIPFTLTPAKAAR